jgi:hypothetical protein
MGRIRRWREGASHSYLWWWGGWWLPAAAVEAEARDGKEDADHKLDSRV